MSRNIHHLPDPIVAESIFQYLDEDSFKNLRSTSTRFHEMKAHINKITYKQYLLYKNYLDPKKITHFNCSDEDISKIPNFPNLTHLDCSGCEKISKIPNFKKLEILHCNSSINISSIPNFPKLIYLNCGNCDISKIPNLPNLEELHCSETGIKELVGLKKLEDLYCPSCEELRSIKNLPKLIYLDCRDCTELYELSNLPKLKECHGCEELDLDY